MNKAIFFDKDGVLNIDKGISTDISEIELFDEAADILLYFKEKGYKIIIVTNQPVVARGLLTEDKLLELLIKFEFFLKKQNSKVKIDKIYYCPHHPNAYIPEYRMICNCRKPKPGTLLKAAKKFNINLKKSIMVGDRLSDVIAGALAECKTVLCRTGKHSEKMIETDLKIDNEIIPDFTILNVKELKEIL